MWRSRPLVVHGPPSIAQVRYTVLAVGKVQPPYADDVAALRAAAGAARARGRGRGRRRRRRGPPDPGARLRLAARRPRHARTTRRRSRAGWRSAGRAGATSASWSAGRTAPSSTRCDHRLSLGADDAAAPARARGAARAALPRPQDPRRRALPSLSVTLTPDRGTPRRRRGRRRRPAQRRAPAPGTRADARAPEEGRLRRLLDQRGDAARARAEGAAARDRRAARRGAAGAPGRAARPRRGRRPRAS